VLSFIHYLGILTALWPTHAERHSPFTLIECIMTIMFIKCVEDTVTTKKHFCFVFDH